MKLYLIRHTSVAVPAGYAYGQTDVPLQASFQQEAEMVKKRLQHESFDQIYCSPLTRCVELANYCGFPQAIKENRIQEISFGEWEMKSWNEISSDIRSKAWFSDWIHVATPGGESLQEQYLRVSHFLNELKELSLQKVCLFTHGGVITCAKVHAGCYELDTAFKDIPPYGSITILNLT